MLVLLAAAGRTQDRPALGPALAEERLRQTLDELREADDAEARAATLARALDEAPEDSELRAILRLVDAALEAGALPPRLPRDRGLLALAARTLPVPTPPAWPEELARQLGRDRALDAAWLEWIAKAPPEASRPVLEDLVDRGARLRLDARSLANALHRFGAIGRLDDLARLDPLRRRPESEVAHYAGSAFSMITGNAARARSGEDWARVHEALARAEALRPSLLVEAGVGLLRDRRELDRADALLREAAARTRASRGSAELVLHAEARLGHAWIAFLEGDVATAVTRAEEAAALPREPGEREDGVRVVRLKARLVSRMFRAMQGEDVGEELASLLERHPAMWSFNPVDGAWWGRLGPDAMSIPLREGGWADAYRAAAESVLQQIERTAPATGNGLLDRRADEEERPVCWVFLGVATLQLQDAADLELALDTVQSRLGALEQMTGWRNQDLLARARLLEARIHLYRGEGSDAMRAADAAREVAGALETALAESSIQTLAQQQLPPTPTGVVLWSGRDYYSPLLARTHRIRANLEATLEGDARAASRELAAAGRHEDWSGDRWLAAALDWARRGHGELARRCLRCVEPLPDHLYDRACIAARLGDAETSVRLLHEHLQRRSHTEAGRRLEARYMQRDPDLAAARGHPDFPRPD